jgi:hypothetical protein
VDGQDGVSRVVLVGEEGSELPFREVGFEPAEGLLDLGFDLFAL